MGTGLLGICHSHVWLRLLFYEHQGPADNSIAQNLPFECLCSLEHDCGSFEARNPQKTKVEPNITPEDMGELISRNPTVLWLPF